MIMSDKMNILAINPGHNGSVALLVNGELKFYVEEERLSRTKYDANPFLGIHEALKYGVDVVAIGGTSSLPSMPWTGEDPYTALVRKYNPNVKVVNISNEHHIGHAATAFFNSGFEEAVAVIVDGSGSYHASTFQENQNNGGFETESIIDCSYNDELFKKLYVSYASNDTKPYYTDNIVMDSSITITKAYEAVTNYLGFHFIEAGKTMGLAPYGAADNNISNLFINGRGDKNLFWPNYPAGAFIVKERYPYLNYSNNPTEWHNDPSKVTDAAKNLAWKVQQETQELVGDLIEKAAALSGKNNIVISGGYALNCVANYYYKKRFPDYNIYIEPISHDGGTAIGIAKLVYYTETKDKTIRPLKSLYLGPEYNTIELKDDSVEIQEVSASDVAKLISEKNIVAMFQGRSEAGPRALGNRSILYDPTDVNGKEHVNKVKGREWFRPFAGSILQEYFEEWFETHGIEESPHMMYAMDFKLEKHGEVPAITHVDGSCRIQTVTQEQNKKYYELIDEFRKITGMPLLFNTSFNLAGEPLVETLEDAIRTIKNSDIKYLYLPEFGKLVTYAKNDSTIKLEDIVALENSNNNIVKAEFEDAT